MDNLNDKNNVEDYYSTNYIKRRDYPRLKASEMNIPIDVEMANITDDKQMNSSGKIINISRGGVLALLDKSLSVSGRVQFNLNFPEPYNPIHGNGRIMWSMVKDDNIYHGIRFNVADMKNAVSKLGHYIEESIPKEAVVENKEESKIENKIKINPSSPYIPKNKMTKSYDKRKEERRRKKILIGFKDRRIIESREKVRRKKEDRRDRVSPFKIDKRESNRRRKELMNYSKEFITHRREWINKRLNINLNHTSNFSFDPQNAKGNIENMIGAAQTPIGIAGPLKINGEYAKGDFYIPMATTEGALVMTFQWGMQAISLAGGANVKILKDKVHVSPVFLFNNLKQCLEFEQWVNEHFEKIKKEAEKTTKYGKLLSIEPRVTGNKVILIFYYSTGDAAGQNMVAIATDNACNFISKQTGFKFYLKSNFSSDKKTSAFNYIEGYGKSVIAEITIPAKITKRILNVTPEEIINCYQAGVVASSLAGMIGINCHFANGLAALFMACGQDVAHISNSHSGLSYCECTKDGSLYVSVYLPDLIVGTVGGGTSLSTQKECLNILDCYGEGKAKKFAEISAATVIAGEVSIGAALANGSFSQGHIKYRQK